MTARVTQAAQAALAAAVIAAVAAVISLYATGKADDLLVVPWAAGATLIVAFLVWHASFPSPRSRSGSCRCA